MFLVKSEIFDILKNGESMWVEVWSRQILINYFSLGTAERGLKDIDGRGFG